MVMTRIPMAEPALRGNELAYLQECVDTGYVSSVGPFVARFEEAFASFVGAKYAVACGSGTAALHVAFHLLGANGETWVPAPSLTFIASINAIAYTTASVVLVDSERQTWNMDTEMLYDWVCARANTGKSLPAAIEIVHLLGHAARMEPLIELRDRFGIPIVEDAAEALGAKWLRGPGAGQQVGTLGRIGCFSFNGNKVITTGGGGMIVTDEEELAARARHLTTQARLKGLDYVHDEMGFNYRLSNLSAAVGLAQLEQLPEFLEAKRRIATRYREGLADTNLEMPPAVPWAEPSFWLFSVLARDRRHRDELRSGLAERGIESRSIWRPIHLQDPYAGAERLAGQVAESLFDRALSLPSSSSLSPVDQDRVIDAIHEALQEIG